MAEPLHVDDGFWAVLEPLLPNAYLSGLDVLVLMTGSRSRPSSSC